MAEKWKEFYKKDELKKLQHIELENLQVFIQTCEKYNLEYFLYGGTLLGAEKYHGMIPWDDDIDVAMPRESYERFVSIANDVLPQGWFIQTPQNCAVSPFPYTKLRKEGTKYIEYVNRKIDMPSGIYIDIYPVDKIPDDEILRKKQFAMVRRWIDIFVIRQSNLYDKPDEHRFGYLRRLGKFVVCKLMKFIPKDYCVKKYEHYMTMYNNSDATRYAALNSPNIDNIYLQLYPLQKMKFEGIDVVIPGDHKTHLKMRYGDYEADLPEEKRYGHVPYILDLGEEWGI